MINYKKTILLTGAGFSKNFGGYLAKEIWSKIFNNPELDRHSNIKEKLKFNFDFESIYAEVLGDESISLDAKEDFQKIIIKAYVDMDEMLGKHVSNDDDPYQIYFGGVSQFLGLFAGKGNEVGIHFTLNQDLFMERKSKRRALGLALTEYNNYNNLISEGRIDSTAIVNLPDKNFVDEYNEKHLSSAGDLFYIKLHGSLGWYSSSGAKKMVLGNNKLTQILNEPLLKWYFEIFEKALCREGVRLFVVGYGFSDTHINSVILKGIKEHGLKLYIISPVGPEDFKIKLTNKTIANQLEIGASNEEGKIFWDAVEGFYPYLLKEIFPSNQSITDKREDLFNSVKL